MNKVATTTRRPVLDAKEAALELLARRVMELEGRVARLEVVARRAAIEGAPVDLPA